MSLDEMRVECPHYKATVDGRGQMRCSNCGRIVVPAAHGGWVTWRVSEPPDTSMIPRRTHEVPGVTVGAPLDSLENSYEPSSKCECHNVDIEQCPSFLRRTRVHQLANDVRDQAAHPHLTLEDFTQEARGKNANTRQVGGSHYGLSAFQHWDMVVLFDLDYFQSQITKYVMRHKKKHGVEDLRKAQHFLEKYIEVLEHPPAEVPGASPQHPLVISHAQANDPLYKLPPNVRYVRVMYEDLITSATTFEARGEEMRRSK